MTEDIWVGSWRPHHPRGPIMALYTSPGPKYMIPGTTGFVKHTPTKPRAPAYSFRGAPMVLTENYSPGPRYSVNPKILRTGKDMGPAYSILGRYQTKTITTPGPGQYSPEKSIKYVFNSAPSHSISARTKSFRVDSTPAAPRTRTALRRVTLAASPSARRWFSPSRSVSVSVSASAAAEAPPPGPGPAR
ncbi:ciliary microtubule associated protein 1A [Petaurus breviceps papuanus]|uniref:ciliary microtubule associated protein 1A n=1 Tax=Petaurus breviceps papuanus TaxID=3040969 RepID=UPI0036D9B871